MNILFLSRLFYPHIGGVEKHTREVAKRLMKKGHLVAVLTEQLDNSNNLTEKINGIKIVRMPPWEDNWSKKFKIWWWLWQNRKLMEKADIVHAHDVFFWFLPFRFLCPKKPVFTTFHGYETKFPPAQKAILVRKLSEKLSWGNICVGNYISKWYGTKTDYITYGGVEKTQNSTLRPFGPSTKLRAQGSGRELKILFIGRLEKDTGVSIYLKSLKILKEKRINFEFEACGDGSLKRDVQEWGRVNGFVENLTPYITKSNLVFASSYLSILQAMVNKKFVLAVFNNPLKEDYLKMTPFAKWIIIESSPTKLVRKIMYYLDHQVDREKLVKGAYNWVNGQTWEEVVGIYESLYSNYSS